MPLPPYLFPSAASASALDFQVERSVAVSVAPAVEPVTAAELRTHLRLISTADDTYLASIVKAARFQLEAETDRAIPPQTLVYRRRGFPVSRDWFELPRAPARAITSITYIDDDTGTATTLATSVYDLDITQEPARVYLKDGQDWPSPVRDITASVVVTYTAGWADAASIPENARMATLWLAAWWYEMRLPVQLGVSVTEVPHHLERVIEPLRVYVSAP